MDQSIGTQALRVITALLGRVRGLQRLVAGVILLVRKAVRLLRDTFETVFLLIQILLKFAGGLCFGIWLDFVDEVVELVDVELLVVEVKLLAIFLPTQAGFLLGDCRTSRSVAVRAASKSAVVRT